MFRILFPQIIVKLNNFYILCYQKTATNRALCILMNDNISHSKSLSSNVSIITLIIKSY